MASLKKISGSNIQVLDDDPITAGAAWASGVYFCYFCP